jgi:hypothetical protein
MRKSNFCSLKSKGKPGAAFSVGAIGPIRDDVDDRAGRGSELDWTKASKSETVAHLAEHLGC